MGRRFLFFPLYMSFYQAREVLPGLWVGSSADSRDKHFLSKHDIALVVNATKTIPFATSRILGFRVPVNDDPDENDNMLEYFNVTNRIIDDTLKSGKTVLVHCYAGIQRSCALAAAYIIYTDNVPSRRAIAIIKQKKTEAFSPVPTFGKALDAFARSRV